jgi:hypothetical protein
MLRAASALAYAADRSLTDRRSRISSRLIGAPGSRGTSRSSSGGRMKPVVAGKMIVSWTLRPLRRNLAPTTLNLIRGME